MKLGNFVLGGLFVVGGLAIIMLGFIIFFDFFEWAKNDYFIMPFSGLFVMLFGSFMLLIWKETFWKYRNVPYISEMK